MDSSCIKKYFVVSNIWRGIVDFIPQVGLWLAWKFGNGHSVLVGEYSYIGGEIKFKLSKEQTNVHRSKGIYVLAQVAGNITLFA